MAKKRQTDDLSSKTAARIMDIMARRQKDLKKKGIDVDLVLLYRTGLFEGQGLLRTRFLETEESGQALLKELREFLGETGAF
ncbi:MAG: hypothetical protein Q8N51_08635 [Gammaproteobacteria bacterium]|nr:hypothetical protein [Gammaproteobacteria bacterium]